MTPQLLRNLLPVASLALLLAAIFWLQPRTMSYFGLNLLGWLKGMFGGRKQSSERDER